VARRATKIEQERKANGSVLVLDAGNSLTGDRDPARKSEGATSIEAMNLLGYDAMALGPLDLVLGPSVLAERITEARFAILSANAKDLNTGELIAKPSVILDRGGHRIAIVGVSGQDSVDGIAIGDPVETVKQVVAALKLDADEIIVLSNAGAAVNQRIADSVPGITAIVGGGKGGSVKPWVSGVTQTPVFHADEASPGHAGRILGIARLVLGPDGVLTDFGWQRFSLGPEVPDDNKIASWVSSQTGG
jgi:2',3'-cyclic-nucleotide 2'-phosphodiesterase (5'-nucleotidase family)